MWALSPRGHNPAAFRGVPPCLLWGEGGAPHGGSAGLSMVLPGGCPGPPWPFPPLGAAPLPCLPPGAAGGPGSPTAWGGGRPALFLCPWPQPGLCSQLSRETPCTHPWRPLSGCPVEMAPASGKTLEQRWWQRGTGFLSLWLPFGQIGLCQTSPPARAGEATVAGPPGRGPPGAMAPDGKALSPSIPAGQVGLARAAEEVGRQGRGPGAHQTSGRSVGPHGIISSPTWVA